MSTSDAPTRGPARPAPYITAGVLIAIAIVMPLCVPIYARMDPTLGGIPFFYWYQMLWVIIAAILVGISYVVVKKEDDRRRAAVRGTGADSDGSTGQ